MKIRPQGDQIKKKKKPQLVHSFTDTDKQDYTSTFHNTKPT